MIRNAPAVPKTAADPSIHGMSEPLGALVEAHRLAAVVGLAAARVAKRVAARANMMYGVSRDGGGSGDDGRQWSSDEVVLKDMCTDEMDFCYSFDHRNEELRITSSTSGILRDYQEGFGVAMAICIYLSVVQTGIAIMAVVLPHLPRQEDPTWRLATLSRCFLFFRCMSKFCNEFPGPIR